VPGVAGVRAEVVSQRLPLPAALQVVSSSSRGQTHQAVPQAAWRLARAAWSCGCVQAGGRCAVTNLGLWSGIEELGLCNAQPGLAALGGRLHSVELVWWLDDCLSFRVQNCDVPAWGKVPDPAVPPDLLC